MAILDRSVLPSPSVCRSSTFAWMQGARVHIRLAALTGTLKPCLRVVALAYTGLGGMLAMMVVVSVALVPVAPVLQQVTEPARQVVSNLVKPSSVAVGALLGSGPVVVHVERPAPQSPVALIAETIPEITIEEAVVAEIPPELPPAQAMVALAAAAPRVVAPVAEVESSVDELAEEDYGLEPIEISTPRRVEPAIAPTLPVADLQIASQEAPKPLPVVPTPTETTRQVKVRLDKANQAAIDAAKAAQVSAKAAADAANTLAIAAIKAGDRAEIAASVATALPTPLATPATAPTAQPASVLTTLTPVPASAPSLTAARPSGTPSKAAADAANQAAIDAAKLAQTLARLEANTANQAALAAAKLSKSGAATTPTSTTPIAPVAQPTPQAVPIVAVVEAGATAAPVVDAEAVFSADVIDAEETVDAVQYLDIDESSLDEMPMNWAATHSDASDSTDA